MSEVFFILNIGSRHMTTRTLASDSHPPVSYIHNPAFEDGAPEDFICISEGSIYSDRHSEETLELDGCGDFELLTDLPLLSPAGETFLFRKMNYLKFCAEQARRLNTEAGDEQYRRCLEDADSVRNHIAECNLRLVISIARKFSNSNCDFDDLMSEGNEILLKAITKFDFSRGFRFSTYATHSVQRHFFRYTQRQQKRNMVEYRSAVEILNEVPADELDPLIAQWIQEEERISELVARMAERLDEREQVVISGRFGLSTGGVVRTLRELATDLGLSKERVRQLQIAAVDKLRDLFDDLGPDYAGASV